MSRHPLESLAKLDMHAKLSAAYAHHLLTTHDPGEGIAQKIRRTGAWDFEGLLVPCTYNIPILHTPRDQRDGNV
jgi:hypothetical protein